MKSCKNCLSFDVCDLYIIDKDAEYCKYFKDKNQFIKKKRWILWIEHNFLKWLKK